MFKRYDVSLTSNPVCSNPVTDIEQQDFFYYDKDGFELNTAERKFYAVMNYPINNPILNHTCWQEPWLELMINDHRLILDHSMFLCRCSYDHGALEQLQKLKSQIPQADLLIKTKPKWGFDFALDAVDNQGSIYEVLHIEYDNYEYNEFCKHLDKFESTISQIDWYHASKKILENKQHWQTLKSFAQNDWKAQFLLGWKKAEYTEKSLTY
jgi:hypothetical protein